MVDYYPPVSFHFMVTFNFKGQKAFKGLDDKQLTSMQHDIKFQSVSGLDVQTDIENYKEGGVNQYEHVLPSRTKYSDLVLKRGMLRPDESAVTDWCIKSIKNQRYEPIDLVVYLLNDEHQNLVYWKVIHAWPKSWKFNELNAEKGEIFIETLELNYNRFEFVKGN